MFIDYTDDVETLMSVADALLRHAGRCEVFKDENGLICVRLPLQAVYSARRREEIAVEVGEFDPAEFPVPEGMEGIERLGPSRDATEEQRTLFAGAMARARGKK